MFRNYAITALRNLVRNRLYAAINIIGLAVGFAAALLIALYIHDETSYDQWIPGHEHTYLLATNEIGPDKRVNSGATSDPEVAAQLKIDFPAIQETARMSFALDGESLRRGEVEGSEMLFWADPNIFAVLPMPVVAGNLATALEQPDGIVLTRSTARKYFGREEPVGQTIEISRKHPMQVTAVIEDLPSSSHLRVDAIASGHAPFSNLAAADARPSNPNVLIVGAFTYLRLASRNAADELQAALPDFVKRHKNTDVAESVSLNLVPLTAIHLTLPTQAIPGGYDMSPAGSMATIYAFSFIGLLIVAVAGINFINLMTARAGRRAVEIGVRKVSGAERRHLIAQFIGEAFLYVGLALILAIALARAVLPALNGALDRAIPSLFVQAPAFLLALLALSAMTAILAGFYPALVLSAFRPVVVLRSAKADNPGGARLREVLVILQFAVLIGLVLVAGIAYRQTTFALRESLRLDTDQVLIVNGPFTPRGPQPATCRPAFKDAVAALPGVRGVQCSSSGALHIGGAMASVLKDFVLINAAADYDFFNLYGVKPLAGRVFEPERGDMEAGQNAEATTVVPAILNETASRKFGFLSPKKAIGQVVDAGATPFGTANQIEIIGVVPDFVTDVHFPVKPTAYFMAPKLFDMLSARLAGRDIPETLEAIDRLWKQYGDPIPTPRRFLNSEIESRHRDITQQARLFAVFSGIAAFIALLGMVGLATFVAERRTKEIGIRKAMGASRADVLRLLLWQFAKPVLWANLIAWPVAGYLMNRWLHGFAYHVDLDPLIFLGASAAALLIALATVAGHALLVARAKPVAALRYE